MTKSTSNTTSLLAAVASTTATLALGGAAALTLTLNDLRTQLSEQATQKQELDNRAWTAECTDRQVIIIANPGESAAEPLNEALSYLEKGCDLLKGVHTTPAPL
jgi:hypothetical protein